MPLSARPRELKLATAFAAAALVFNLAVTILNRENIGEGWVVWLMFQFLITAVIAVFLVFSYNGRGWVRFLMLVIYSIGYYRTAMTDYRLFFDPIMIIGVLLTFAAIVCWFSPNTSRWYRNPRST